MKCPRCGHPEMAVRLNYKIGPDGEEHPAALECPDCGKYQNVGGRHCAVSDCDAPVYCRGCCRKHSNQMRDRGWINSAGTTAASFADDWQEQRDQGRSVSAIAKAYSVSEATVRKYTRGKITPHQSGSRLSLPTPSAPEAAWAMRAI